MSSISHCQPERWTQSTLKSRGWSLSLIRRFLDPPDATAPNPHYRSAAAPMKLYDAARVQATEATPIVMAALAQTHQRSLRAKDRAAHQRQAVLAAVRAWHIHVPFLPPDHLLAQAVRHYNTLWSARGRDDKWATIHDDPEFLERITVNYLRHACTNYEDRLVELYGATGAAEARPLLKHRILTAIAATYPTLATACQRQAAKLEEEPP